MSDRFVPHAILLAGEGERNERGSLKFREGTLEGIERSRADPALDVADAEQGVEGVVGEAEILAGPEQKIEAKDEAVRSSLGEWMGILLHYGDGLGQ